jgi:hypothetical protein
MAQAIYCPSCQVVYAAQLRGGSCPACGEELIHARFPAGMRPKKKKTPHISSSVWDHILKKDPCSICGDKEDIFHKVPITIDHIHPKALGGSKGSWTNRTGMCRPCNAAKAHTPLLFFLLQRTGEAPEWLWDEEGHWPIPEETPQQQAARTAHEEETATESHNFNAQEFISAERRAAKLLALKGLRIDRAAA